MSADANVRRPVQFPIVSARVQAMFPEPQL